MPVFTPSRLTLARERRGMTKNALARATNLTTRAISFHEKGDRVPSEENLQAFSDVLNFPVSFFYLDDIEKPDPQNVAFRALSKMTARSRNEVISASAIALEFSDWIEREFNLPAVDVPDLGSPEIDAAAAAMELRVAWGLGHRPISNMIHLLESKGVRVFSIAKANQSVNAFSLWQGERPFVFLHTDKTPERSRFDCAHELAHLVLHQHGPNQGREAEIAADTFAGTFLIPQASLRAQSSRVMSLRQMFTLKKRWGVSIAALVYRLHAVGMISEWTYRQHMIDISKRGWRKSEPHSITRERSLVLEKVFRLLRSEGMTTRHVAEQLHISPQEIHELTFGLAPVLLRDGETPPTETPRPRRDLDPTSPDRTPTRPQRTHLRLVR